MSQLHTVDRCGWATRLQAPERLEDRLLLAGNVTVTYAGGSLDILGDDAGNIIEVFSDGVDVVVIGKGTTINGSNDPLVLAGAATYLNYGITIDLGGGNDQITMRAQNETGSGFGTSVRRLHSLGVMPGWNQVGACVSRFGR